MWISHQKILIVKMVFQQIYPRGIYLVAKFLLLMVVTFRFNNYVSGLCCWLQGNPHPWQ